ncbi:unnamed protein product [Caenorhabditis nigoni]
MFRPIPAASGMTLGAIQLSLFLVFPRTREDLSPLEILAQWFTGRDILEMERKLKSDQGPYKIKNDPYQTFDEIDCLIAP